MNFSYQISAMKMISNIDELRGSGFGRPRPRHGLRLLHWFSHKYINMDIYSRMTLQQDHPQSGAFGFCSFHNKERILPMQNLPYYEVGNLHGSGSYKLPLYVRQNDTHQSDESNKDRIIIRLNGRSIEKVYVTEHKDLRNFNPAKTYEVSQRLIEQIRRMKLEQFLQSCNNNQGETTNQTCAIVIDNQPNNYSSFREERKCWCTIL